MATKTAKTKPETVLVLRTCNADMTSYGGFKWPKKGVVECPDWRDDYKCGHGLHGLLWGIGNGSLLDWTPEARWVVVRVLASDIRTGQSELTDKCKFPRGVVVYAGQKDKAVAMVCGESAEPEKCVGRAISTTGCAANAITTGYAANASTTGYAANASTTGYAANASTTGDAANASTTGARANASTTGYAANASTTGDDAIAVAIGTNGSASAKTRGVVVLRWWDGARFRCTVGYVGENGILPGVAYRCDNTGKLVPVDPAKAAEVAARIAKGEKE